MGFLAQLITESSWYPFASRLRRTTVKALFVRSFFCILSGSVLNPQKYKWTRPSQWRRVRDIYCSPLWWFYWKLQLGSEVNYTSESRRVVQLTVEELLKRMRSQINILKLCEEKPEEREEVYSTDNSTDSETE